MNRGNKSQVEINESIERRLIMWKNNLKINKSCRKTM